MMPICFDKPRDSKELARLLAECCKRSTLGFDVEVNWEQVLYMLANNETSRLSAPAYTQAGKWKASHSDDDLSFRLQSSDKEKTSISVRMTTNGEQSVFHVEIFLGVANAVSVDILSLLFRNGIDKARIPLLKMLIDQIEE